MSQSRHAYVHARLGRAGLGNMLFPWARAEIFAHRHHLPMLAPQWTQPKIGPLLRGEKDLRYYTGLFDNSHYLRGLRKWAALLCRARVSEDRAEAAAASPGMAARTLIVFEGMDGQYQPLFDHRDLVRRRLLEIISQSVKRRLSAEPTPPAPWVGMHVRRGDTLPLEYGEPFPPGQFNRVQPLEWFIQCVNNIRRLVGNADIPVKVFSDARAHEIGPLLAQGNVTLARPNPSIVDMILLSRSSILVTTGPSTFSAWAAFLGEMPALWYPGLRRSMQPTKPHFDAETDLWGNVPEAFAPILRSALAIR